MSIKKCECGSKEFYLTETLSHRAELENGELSVYKTDGCIDEIVCQKCQRGYKYEDFRNIIF